jgi:hypothetical protein
MQEENLGLISIENRKDWVKSVILVGNARG